MDAGRIGLAGSPEPTPVVRRPHSAPDTTTLPALAAARSQRGKPSAAIDEWSNPAVASWAKATLSLTGGSQGARPSRDRGQWRTTRTAAVFSRGATPGKTLTMDLWFQPPRNDRRHARASRAVAGLPSCRRSAREERQRWPEASDLITLPLFAAATRFIRGRGRRPTTSR